MKDPTEKVLAQCVQMRADGAKWPAILAATGLSHSQAEIAVWQATIPAERFAEAQDLIGKNGLPKASRIMRDDQGLSWGLIGVLAGEPEGKVRRAYTEATAIKHQGQRIGHGGRWLYGDPELYVDNLKPTGTYIPKDQVGREGARRVATYQRLAGLELAELRNLAADLGLEGMEKATKAKVIVAIGTAWGYDPITKPKAAKAS